MSRLVLVGAAAVMLVAAAVIWQNTRSTSSSPIQVADNSKPPEAAPLCPWREPETDLRSFFTNATGYKLETVALSGLRVELAQRLGRSLTPDENLLHIYRVHNETGLAGAVLTRRVKGTYGAIEIVIATDPEEKVRGVRIQRMREPESIGRVLDDPQWLSWFHGKSAISGWQLGRDIPDVAEEARGSATAILEGVRDSLILLSAAHESSAKTREGKEHH